MNKILSLGALIISLIMILAGTTIPAAAQDDPVILVKIAQNAQDQIRKNLLDNPSDKTKQLFQDGSAQVDALILSVTNNDINSAKKPFLSAMAIFKETSQLLTPNTQLGSSLKFTDSDPSSDFMKLYRYTSSLKTITEKYNVLIDFEELDNLFIKADKQISTKQFSEAQETIHTIKQVIDDVKNQLRVQASQQESERVQKYAQKYLEQLDRVIESAKTQNIPDDRIHQLEEARNKLSLAKEPADIVNQVRKINSIKADLELTKNDLLQSRIIYAEKILQGLYDNKQLTNTELEDSEKTLQAIKHHLYENQFEQANTLLQDLVDRLHEIPKSLS